VLTSVLAVLAPASALSAELTPKDVQIIGRALAFVENPPTGTVRLGIVFSPSIPISAQQANSLQALLADGVTVGKVTLLPTLIPVDRLFVADDLGAVFVTSGLGTPGPALTEAARRRLPIFSTDIACVNAGHCLLGFRSEPTVEIVISKTASEVSGVSFTPAFRMLVKEH
jgi:hypothetical protein